MTKPSALKGGCLCGAVRFVADGVDTGHHACHCSMCRRWASGPVFAADTGSVQFTGEEHITRYDSSEWAARGFCKNCGSHLFYYLKPAGAYHLCVGAFDDPAQFQLDVELFVDRKPAGYAFKGAKQQLTEEQVFAAFNGD
jgi:hypothetical protein